MEAFSQILPVSLTFKVPLRRKSLMVVIVMKLQRCSCGHFSFTKLRSYLKIASQSQISKGLIKRNRNWVFKQKGLRPISLLTCHICVTLESPFLIMDNGSCCFSTGISSPPSCLCFKMTVSWFSSKSLNTCLPKFKF